jgi:hypothetical protein
MRKAMMVSWSCVLVAGFDLSWKYAVRQSAPVRRTNGEQPFLLKQTMGQKY